MTVLSVLLFVRSANYKQLLHELGHFVDALYTQLLINNSSKMLKGIWDTLMHALITTLASKNRERQLSSSKSLGDLVKNDGQ